MSEMRCALDLPMEFRVIISKSSCAAASQRSAGAEHDLLGAVAQQLVVHLLETFEIAARWVMTLMSRIVLCATRLTAQCAHAGRGWHRRRKQCMPGGASAQHQRCVKQQNVREKT